MSDSEFDKTPGFVPGLFVGAMVSLLLWMLIGIADGAAEHRDVQKACWPAAPVAKVMYGDKMFGVCGSNAGPFLKEGSK